MNKAIAQGLREDAVSVLGTTLDRVIDVPTASLVHHARRCGPQIAMDIEVLPAGDSEEPEVLPQDDADVPRAAGKEALLAAERATRTAAALLREAREVLERDAQEDVLAALAGVEAGDRRRSGEPIRLVELVVEPGVRRRMPALPPDARRAEPVRKRLRKRRPRGRVRLTRSLGAERGVVSLPPLVARLLGGRGLQVFRA